MFKGKNVEKLRKRWQKAFCSRAETGEGSPAAAGGVEGVKGEEGLNQTTIRDTFSIEKETVSL